MEVLPRILHPEQRSSYAPLLEQQRLTWEKFNMGADVEVYGDNGELLLTTSRENPNLDRILAQVRAGQPAPGDLR